MISIEEHCKKFLEIREKYNLSDTEKAEEIAKFLTTHKEDKEQKITIKEFSKLFNINEEDSFIFLTFIEKGLMFKEKHMKKD
jgi:hypothetical protein